MLFGLARLKPSSLPKPQLTRLLSDAVKYTEKGIQLDGRDILHIETRNMCRCEACFGKNAHQCLDQPLSGSFAPGIKVEEIGRMSDHYLGLKWSDGHEGLIARTMRGDYGPNPIQSRMEKLLDLTKRKNTEQKFWGEPDAEVSKLWDYSWVIKDVDNTTEFLTHYMRYGIVFLKGIPAEEGMLDVVEEGLKMKPLRRTVFKTVDLVKYKPTPSNPGYGSGGLAPHLDLSYYYQTPHVQFFHCVENTVEGGESFWVDSFSAIKEMSEKRPDLLEVLKTVPVTYRYTPPGTGLFQMTHHCVVNMLGKDIWQTVDQPFNLDSAMFTRFTDTGTREKFWEAYTYYRGLVEDPSRHYTKRLNSGEFVITDNWRVYHARRPFKKTAPEQDRIVSTSYMDWQVMVNRILSPERKNSIFLETDQH
ncbi:probable gamma-butyrobetaine dioxygenase [Bolinopsis microptera]|uniref:probable gamma-butyrobetaine dioxygenase n=1 Tax=Bolinopsis microptera TaxID=2820187 RepID=UPI00307AFE63